MSDSTSSTSSSSSGLSSISSSVSGDGKTFVSQLKSVLANMQGSTSSLSSEVTSLSNSVAALTASSITNQVASVVVTKLTDTSVKITWATGTFDSTNVYVRAEVLVRVSSTSGDIAVDWTTIDASVYLTADNALSYTVTGLSEGYKYQFKICGISTNNGKSVESGAPAVEYYCAVPTTSTVAAPLTIQAYYTGYGFSVTWTQPDGIDYDYTEVRTDTNFGSDNGNKLLLSRGLTGMVYPTSRSGTFYIANKLGTVYSSQLTCTYSVQVLSAPTNLTATVKMNDDSTHNILIVVGFDTASNIMGTHITIDGKVYTLNASDTSLNFYITKPDTYTITASYFDVFGDGPTSTATATVTNASIADGTFKNVYATSVNVATGTVNEITSQNITSAEIDTSILTVKESFSAILAKMEQLEITTSKGIDTPFIHASSATMDAETVNDETVGKATISTLYFNHASPTGDGVLQANTINASTANISLLNVATGNFQTATTNTPSVGDDSVTVPTTDWVRQLLNSLNLLNGAILTGDVGNSNSWWIKFGCGIHIMIQGGWVDKGDNWVTFPVAFANILTVQSTADYGSSENYTDTAVSGWNNSGFASHSYEGVHWFAIGTW